MPDISTSQSFAIDRSITLNVIASERLPYPWPKDVVEVKLAMSGRASISIPIDKHNNLIHLDGSFDSDRRVIEGDYNGHGPFKMTLERLRPRSDSPTRGRIVRCEVSLSRGGDPGCWIAEEDGCCIQEDDGDRRRRRADLRNVRDLAVAG